MAVPSTEGLEKLEDMIVRAAESTSAHIRAARTAIGAVIFGQDRVVDHALVIHVSCIAAPLGQGFDRCRYGKVCG